MTSYSLKPEHRQLVLVTSLGGFLELYDFAIYALMAGYIADQFFPNQDPYLSLLSSFATFSAGYLARPVGGIIFGHLGDRKGRKPVFVITILMMALPTALIGCLPVYAQIGVWAPVLLVTLRVIQGFSIGGEVPGAMTFLCETLEDRRGMVMALLFMSLVLGAVFGSMLHALLLDVLSKDAMNQWGWRFPFWLGGLFGIFSYLFRRRFQESRLFVQIYESQQRSRVPIKTLFKHFRMPLLCGFLMIVPIATSVPLLLLFTPGYLSHLLHYDPGDVALANALGGVCSSLVFLMMGLLSERFQTRTLLLLASWMLILSAWPIFGWLVNGTAHVILIMCLGSILRGGVAGIAPLTLASIFPVHVRYSGIAFCYNLSFALFSGITPILAIELIRVTGNMSSPAVFLVFGGLSGMLACIIMKRANVKNYFAES
ncbi:MFS transporter [Endozoicomonas numazuensis]|uniref:Major facilitator superfamily (MFS) profile domain-containing protein n=1 Tax=Endozoicomonas numazuensis TaxID=1137799 RepID=A0A081NK02_9GAMM|nr:MFS transporter [Endozoicomonas numazuensis]KEQ18775.1 hypothetical protein GZ78_01400 [Endozoicomonas numazuensis]